MSVSVLILQMEMDRFLAGTLRPKREKDNSICYLG